MFNELKNIFFLFLCLSGLPVSQQRPPGSPPARPQRPGGRAGAGGGDGPAERKSDEQHCCTHTEGETPTDAHTPALADHLQEVAV